MNAWSFEAYIFSDVRTLPITVTHQHYEADGNTYRMTETVLGVFDDLMEAVRFRAEASWPKAAQG